MDPILRRESVVEPYGVPNRSSDLPGLQAMERDYSLIFSLPSTHIPECMVIFRPAQNFRFYVMRTPLAVWVTIESTRHTKRGSVIMWTERVGRPELEWRDHKLAWADIHYKIVNSYVGILMGAWMITSIRLLT